MNVFHFTLLTLPSQLYHSYDPLKKYLLFYIKV